MPKISELQPPSAPLNGAELIPLVQNGLTVHDTLAHVVNLAVQAVIGIGGIPATSMPAFTGEVTAPVGTANLTINKGISPIWSGLHTFGSTSLVPPPAGSLLQMCSLAAGSTVVLFEGHGGTPVFRFHYYNGTQAAPLPVTTGNQVGRIAFQGYFGTDFNTASRISGIVEENWTATANGGGMIFETTPLGSTAAAVTMRLYASGGMSLGVGGTDPGAGSLETMGSVFSQADIFTSKTVYATSGMRLTTNTGNLGGFTWDQINTKYFGLQNGGAAIGWNYTAGGGETDLLLCANGGATNGLYIYDYPAASGPINLLAAIFKPVGGSGTAGGFFVNGSVSMTAGNNIAIGNSVRLVDAPTGFTALQSPPVTVPGPAASTLYLGQAGSGVYLNTDAQYHFRDASNTDEVTIGSYGIAVATSKRYYVNTTQVVGQRVLGWSSPTGAVARGTFDSGASLSVVAQTLGALITDLIAHGLIGSALMTAELAPAGKEPPTDLWKEYGDWSAALNQKVN